MILISLSAREVPTFRPIMFPVSSGRELIGQTDDFLSTELGYHSHRADGGGGCEGGGGGNDC